MTFRELNDSNYLLYAIKNYDNPQCKGLPEFEEDMSRIVYLKRLFRRYKTTGELKERLILNHLIIFGNVFGVEAATRLLFLKIDADSHCYLKTFLIFLNYIRHDKPYKEWGLDLVPIQLDQGIVDRLRGIQ
jgi:hypothetical protein